MHSLINLLAGIAAISAAPTTELHYSGTLSRQDRRGDQLPVKEFDLTFLVSSDDGNRHDLFFLVSEPDGSAFEFGSRSGR